MSSIRTFKKHGFNAKEILRRKLMYRNEYATGLEHDGPTQDAFGDAVRSLLHEDSRARLYGIELEVPGDYSISTSALRKLDALGALRKGDGSLRDCDVEFNFPPLTAEYIKRAKILTKVESVMASECGSPTGNTSFDDEDDEGIVNYGIHIHSNMGWMNMQAAKLVVGIIRDNATFFRWLSGRNGYSPYSSAWGHFDHRYAACLTGRGTIEYRMFRSTYDQRELNVWLDVITALEDWAHSLPEESLPVDVVSSWSPRSAPVSLPVPDAVTLRRFFEFVKSNKKKYRLADRAIDKYNLDSVTSGFHYNSGDYNRYSLYASIDTVYPARKRKVIERAQLPLPIPQAA